MMYADEAENSDDPFNQQHARLIKIGLELASLPAPRKEVVIPSLSRSPGGPNYYQFTAAVEDGYRPKQRFDLSYGLLVRGHGAKRDKRGKTLHGVRVVRVDRDGLSGTAIVTVCEDAESVPVDTTRYEVLRQEQYVLGEQLRDELLDRLGYADHNRELSVYDRGFWGAVKCTWEAWAVRLHSFLPKILPLTTVYLTGSIFCSRSSTGEFYLSIPSHGTILQVPNTSRHRLPGNRPDEDIRARLIQIAWPGLQFHFPIYTGSRMVTTVEPAILS